MGNRWGSSRKCQTLFFGGSKITADGDCSHEIKRCLLLGRKAMTNLDSIFKSRDITLPTKVHLVKAPLFMGFPRQEYRSGLPFPPPGHLPDQGLHEPRSPSLQADSLPSEPAGKTPGCAGSPVNSFGRQRRGPPNSLPPTSAPSRPPTERRPLHVRVMTELAPSAGELMLNKGTLTA